MLVIIVPLPHYDNFATTLFREDRNVSDVGVPPPPHPPTERLSHDFLISWLAQHRHPGAAPANYAA